jgi:predicted transposase YbfD/YdcC
LRDHWSIENNLHWQLDLKQASAEAVLAVFRRAGESAPSPVPHV